MDTWSIVSPNYIVDNGQMPSESRPVCQSKGAVYIKEFHRGRGLCHAANSCPDLQLISGQTTLVKVHTCQVEPTCNSMFQVSSACAASSTRSIPS